MISLFRKPSEPPKNYLKKSLDLVVTADGRFADTTTSVQLSDADVQAEIREHIERLSGLYNQHAQADLANANPEKAKRLTRFKRAIDSAVEDVSRQAYVRSLLNVAEAYEGYAVIDPASSEHAWDYAWDVLNREGLTLALSISKGQWDVLATNYADLLFARAMDYLRRMVAEPQAVDQNGCAGAAVSLFYGYLLTVYKLKLAHWQINDAIRNIHIAAAYGALTSEQLATTRQALTAEAEAQSASVLLPQFLPAVDSYVLPEADHARLAQLVY